MRPLDRYMKSLDPAAADDAEVDAEGLLAQISASGPPPGRGRRSRLPVALWSAGAAVGAVAAALLLLGSSAGAPDVLAKATEAVNRPGSILHFKIVLREPGSATAPEQDLGVYEVWQTSDRNRLRWVSASDGETVDGEWVQTNHGGRTWSARSWNGKNNTIAVTDKGEVPPMARKVPFLPASVGDPATFMERASRREDIKQLEDGSVRGIDVHRFQVGKCRTYLVRVWQGRARPDGTPIGKRRKVTQERVVLAPIVSVRKDNFLPVQIEQPACEQPPAGQNGLRPRQTPGQTVDFLEFEVLDLNDETRKLLEMGEHPGAQVREGKPGPVGPKAD